MRPEAEMHFSYILKTKSEQLLGFPSFLFPMPMGKENYRLGPTLTSEPDWALALQRQLLWASE